MKDMSKRTLVENMREEAERNMGETVGEDMKEEGMQVVEVDINLSSAEGAMGVGGRQRRTGRRWILISHLRRE